MAKQQELDYQAMITERIPFWSSIWDNNEPGNRENFARLWHELCVSAGESPDPPVTWYANPGQYWKERGSESVLFINSGISDACWMEDYLYLEDSKGQKIFADKTKRKQIEIWSQLSRECSFIVGTETQAHVIDRPTRVRYEIRREGNRARVIFHCADGPAISWGPSADFPDGFHVYQFQGLIVPKRVILQRDELTAKEAMKEPNAEIRRIMIVQMGLPKFIKQAGAKCLDTAVQPIPAVTWAKMGLKPSKKAVLNELLELQLGGEFTHRVVRVVDPSTMREYILGVDSGCATVDAALGWTFEMSEKEYKFLVAEN